MSKLLFAMQSRAFSFFCAFVDDDDVWMYGIRYVTALWSGQVGNDNDDEDDCDDVSVVC